MATGRLRVAARTRSTAPRSRWAEDQRGRWWSAGQQPGADRSPDSDCAQEQPEPLCPAFRWRSARTTSRRWWPRRGQHGQQLDRRQRRSSRSRMSRRGPSRRRAVQETVDTGAAGRGSRSLVRMSAEMAKVAGVIQNGTGSPDGDQRTRGWASAIWYMTAADHNPLSVATSSSSVTMRGSTEAEAGLKNTDPAGSPLDD